MVPSLETRTPIPTDQKRPERPRPALRASLAACCGILLLFVPSAADAGPADAAILGVRVGAVTSKSFVVSWDSDASCAGMLHYGPTTALGTRVPDAAGLGPYVHRIAVSGLTPGAPYYFDVECGGVVDDNAGQHYSLVLPGTGSSPPLPDIAYGRVLSTDGATAAPGVLVLVRISDHDGAGTPGASSWLSCSTNALGYWSVDLATARDAGLASGFAYSPAGGDEIAVLALAGNDGSAEASLDIGDSYREGTTRTAIPDLSLVLPAAHVQPGDCNDDDVVDAGDVSALVLEIFDGDGGEPGDAPAGTFLGQKIGCNANEDRAIDAGDISCTVLTIFNGPGSCG